MNFCFEDKDVFFVKLELESRYPNCHYPFVMIIIGFTFSYYIVNSVRGIVLTQVSLHYS